MKPMKEHALKPYGWKRHAREVWSDATSRVVLWLGAGFTVAILVVGGGLAIVMGEDFLQTPDQRAQRLLDAGDSSRAAEVFTDAARRGVAQYRSAEYEDAARTYGGVSGADAAFNHGNALMMRGEYSDAVARFDRALHLRPGWAAAKTNRAIAVGRAERIKREGGNSTEGQLGADDVVFGGSSKDGDSETVEVDQVDDQSVREMWLRQVQTTPRQFLRQKFAYQNQAANAPGDDQERDEP